ncbi:hypothetical protein BaRGS_00017121 [Batillaria attramentaria]|uniref:Uncharacterized protein n=1 Tax=Batillaria attramentaria TaxID=370345 RepID=A0ABD0KWY0_9CAEN
MAEVEIPKGNWVARTLRLMNENSNELFPKTPADARPPSSTPCTSRLPTTFPTEVLLEGLPIQGAYRSLLVMHNLTNFNYAYQMSCQP